MFASGDAWSSEMGASEAVGGGILDSFEASSRETGASAAVEAFATAVA
jgi:hypothetical protein